MSDVVIFGAGELARLARLCLEQDSEHNVVAFTVDRQFLASDSFGGLPLVAFEDVATRYPPSGFEMLVAIGYRRVNRARAEVYERARGLGYRLPTYVSSHAMVAPAVELGDNSILFEGVIVQPFVRIGRDAVIWSGAVIAHDTTIGDHCFIGPRASISGNVTIGDYTFVGNNATVRDGVDVAPHTVVGAGALIKRDTRAGEIYSGTPTRATPNRSSSDLDSL